MKKKRREGKGEIHPFLNLTKLYFENSGRKQGRRENIFFMEIRDREIFSNSWETSEKKGKRERK